LITIWCYMGGAVSAPS